MKNIKLFINKNWYLFALAIITVIGFKLITFNQSNSSILTQHDSSRDILISQHISKFNDFPDNPPFCGGCNIVHILKNSKIYYFFLAIFYKFNGLNGILLLCSLWTTVQIPLVYLLAHELSGSKYAGILASLLFISSPLLTSKTISMMPYQPLFVPTLSCLIIWIMLHNQKSKKISIEIISGIILILGIQFHLSFILLMPFYIYQTTKLIQNSTSKKKLVIIVFNLIIIFIFFKYNINLSPPNSTNKTIDLSNIFVNFNLNINQDLNWLFPFKLSPFIFISLIIILFFTKKEILIKLAPILILYPIVCIYSKYNWYTAIFWPVFITLISTSLMMLKNNFYLFILYTIIIILFIFKYNFTSIISPFEKPSYLSQKVIQSLSDKINNHLIKTHQNYVFQYDWHLNKFMGYYYYQELLNNKNMIHQEESYDITLRILNNNSIDKIIYCSNNDCPYFEVEYKKNFDIKTLEKNNSWTLYQVYKH